MVLIGSGHRALVLGGGGIAGSAWQTGLAAAFDRAGVDLSAADVVLGTSAGATVAAQIASTTGAQEWYRRQVDPAVQNRELRPPGLSVGELWEAMLRIAEEVSEFLIAKVPPKPQHSCASASSIKCLSAATSRWYACESWEMVACRNRIDGSSGCASTSLSEIASASSKWRAPQRICALVVSAGP